MVDSTTLEKVKKYLSVIPKELGVRKAFLFGSYARGTQQQGSDIDIALIMDGFSDPVSVQFQLLQLRRKIDLRIEPHPIRYSDFNPDNPFAYEIEKTGFELKLP